MASPTLLIGLPVKHSLSPVIHNAAYAHLGLPHEFSVAEVAAGQLPEFWRNRPADLQGLAVTAPLKHAVLSYLDAVEPMAATLQVVNSVVFAGGLATGFNTDVYGIRQALCEAPGTVAKLSDPGSLHTVILGAGATAISAMMASAELGVKNLTIIARSFHKPPSLVKVAASLGLTPQLVPLKPSNTASKAAPGELSAPVEKALQRADFMVSTIPAAAAAPLAAALTGNQRQPVVLEADYAGVSALAATAAQVGHYLPGTRQLLHQAVQQFSLHTGRAAPVEVMESALAQALAEKAAAAQDYGQGTAAPAGEGKV